MGSSDGSLMVSMMSHLRVHFLETLFGSYDGIVPGLCDRTKNEVSTLGLSPGYTEGWKLGSEEGMVPGTGEVYL